MLDHFDYMLMHVRMHSIADVSTWSEVEIIAAYCLLKPPKIVFSEWQQRFDTAAPTKEDVNEAAMTQVKAMQSMDDKSPIKIETAAS